MRSVLLVADVSREKIGSVALDPASRTSAALTRILLKRVYGLQPEYREANGEWRMAKGGISLSAGRPSPFPGAADAALIIGDPALKARLNGHVVLDLAAEWRAFSGHSFVFAFWAVRADAATAEVSEILRRSYAAGQRHFGDLVEEESASTGLSEAVVEDYLRHSLHYELDAGDLAGLDLFFRIAAEDGLIEQAAPLRFLPS